MGSSIEETGFDFRQGQEMFLIPIAYRQVLGLPRLLSNWCKGNPPGVNRPGWEADQSHPEVKNASSFASTTPYIFVVLN
jgi:hypothetical protein